MYAGITTQLRDMRLEAVGGAVMKTIIGLPVKIQRLHRRLSGSIGKAI